MSSFVPDQKVFDRAWNFCKKAFDGDKPTLGYKPIGDVDIFMEKLMNLCIMSVHRQYEGDQNYPHTVEIFTPQYMPQEFQVTAIEALKALNCIHYQIEYPHVRNEVYMEAFAHLNEARYAILAHISKIEKNKLYNDAPWSNG